MSETSPHESKVVDGNISSSMNEIVCSVSVMYDISTLMKFGYFEEGKHVTSGSTLKQSKARSVYLEFRNVMIFELSKSLSKLLINISTRKGYYEDFSLCLLGMGNKEVITVEDILVESLQGKNSKFDQIMKYNNNAFIMVTTDREWSEHGSIKSCYSRISKVFVEKPYFRDERVLFQLEDYQILCMSRFSDKPNVISVITRDPFKNIMVISLGSSISSSVVLKTYSFDSWVGDRLFPSLLEPQSFFLIRSAHDNPVLFMNFESNQVDVFQNIHFPSALEKKCVSFIPHIYHHDPKEFLFQCTEEEMLFYDVSNHPKKAFQFDLRRNHVSDESKPEYEMNDEKFSFGFELSCSSLSLEMIDSFLILDGKYLFAMKGTGTFIVYEIVFGEDDRGKKSMNIPSVKEVFRKEDLSSGYMYERCKQNNIIVLSKTTDSVELLVLLEKKMIKLKMEGLDLPFANMIAQEMEDLRERVEFLLGNRDDYEEKTKVCNLSIRLSDTKNLYCSKFLIE